MQHLISLSCNQNSIIYSHDTSIRAESNGEPDTVDRRRLRIPRPANNVSQHYPNVMSEVLETLHTALGYIQTNQLSLKEAVNEVSELVQAKLYLSETWLLFRFGYCAYEILWQCSFEFGWI